MINIMYFDIEARAGSPVILQVGVRAAHDAHLFFGVPGEYGFEVVML